MRNENQLEEGTRIQTKLQRRGFSSIEIEIREALDDKPSAIPAALLRSLTTPCVLKEARQMTTRFLA
jgi:hypothetical protein